MHEENHCAAHSKALLRFNLLHIERYSSDSAHHITPQHSKSYGVTYTRTHLHTLHCIAFNCTAYCTALHSRALHGNASFCILHGIAFQCIDCMFIRTFYFTLMYVQYTCVNSLTLHNTTEHELEP